MAQIVTITNPLTGQPAQVDQLDHTAQEIDDAIARALPGGAIDITLQNKAPGGFGLGTISQTVTDFDTVKLNGWYFGAIGTAHAPDSVNEWSVRVTNLAHNSEVCVQDAYAITNVNKYLHRRRLVYISIAAQDNPWEWVNPPMLLGVEYRTTERYLGKPVYVMVVDCGSVEANTWKQVNNFGANVKDVVRFSAIGIEGTYGETVALPSNSEFLQLRAFVNRTVINNMYVAFKCDQRSLSEVKFTLWYTKTTD